MTYTRLPSRNLDKSAGLLRPACVLPDRVGLDNPALDVMTDFRRLTAFIATPGDTIRQAEERMVRRKVRLLTAQIGFGQRIVTQPGGGQHQPGEAPDQQSRQLRAYCIVYACVPRRTREGQHDVHLASAAPRSGQDALQLDHHAAAHSVAVSAQDAGDLVETHQAAQLDVLANLGDQGLAGLIDGAVGPWHGLLCQFAADATQRPVLAGPVEATAMGNCLMQVVALGHLGSQWDARAVVRSSSQVLTFAWSAR